MIVASIVQTPDATPYSGLHLHHLFDDHAPRTKSLAVNGKDGVTTLFKAIRYVEESDQLYLIYRDVSGEDGVHILCNIYKDFISGVQSAATPPNVNISEHDEVDHAPTCDMNQSGHKSQKCVIA